MAPQKILELAESKGFTCYLTHSTSEALLQASQVCGKKDLVSISGSLYLAGEAREIVLGKNSWSLLNL